MFFKKKTVKQVNTVMMVVDDVLSSVVLYPEQIAVRACGRSKDCTNRGYGIVINDTPVFHTGLNVTIKPGDKIEFIKSDLVIEKTYILFYSDVCHVIYPVEK